MALFDVYYAMMIGEIEVTYDLIDDLECNINDLSFQFGSLVALANPEEVEDCDLSDDLVNIKINIFRDYLYRHNVSKTEEPLRAFIAFFRGRGLRVDDYWYKCDLIEGCKMLMLKTKKSKLNSK